MKDRFIVITISLLKIFSVIFLFDALILLGISALYNINISTEYVFKHVVSGFIDFGIFFYLNLIIVILFFIFAIFAERWFQDKIIRNNIIYKNFVILLFLSLIILGLKIFTFLYSYWKYFTEYYSLFDIIFFIIGEIRDILYIPLWCITLSLIISFCYNKIKNK